MSLYLHPTSISLFLTAFRARGDAGLDTAFFALAAAGLLPRFGPVTTQELASGAPTAIAPPAFNWPTVLPTSVAVGLSLVLHGLPGKSFLIFMKKNSLSR